MTEEYAAVEDTLAEYTDAAAAMKGCMEDIGISDAEIDPDTSDPGILKASMNECIAEAGFDWDHIAGKDLNAGSEYNPGSSSRNSGQGMTVMAPVTVTSSCMINTLMDSH